MTDRDSFLREVDEAVRQDQYKKLWDKYGIYALAWPCSSWPASAAYKGWSYWQEHQAQEAGAKFSQALTMEDGADAAKAHEMLTALAQSGPEGYRVLARFQLAAAEAKAGEIDKAVADYDALAVIASVDPILQGHATLQAAALRLDKADYAEMERRLKGLIDSDSAWRLFCPRAARAVGLPTERYARGREAIQRAGRRPGHPAEFAGTRRHDACADRGDAAGLEHHGKIAWVKSRVARSCARVEHGELAVASLAPGL